MTTETIAERFARDTANHKMTVLHDDGLYRHLRFRAERSFYWFDLITVPGALIFRGDGESYVFSRMEDMFEFFRSSAYKGEPNVMYWAEKVTSDQKALKRYSYERFVSTVKETLIDRIRSGDVPPGTSKALIEQAEDDYDVTYEEGARALLDEFEHKGFRFGETWEWDFSDYDWWFVWALHGILWGIAQYDQDKAAEVVVHHSDGLTMTVGGVVKG